MQLRDTTFPDLFWTNSANIEAKIALRVHNENREITYGKLRDQACHLMATLAPLGPQARISMIIDDKLLTTVSVIAAMSLRQIYNPIDVRDFTQITPLLNTLEPQCILYSAASLDISTREKITANHPNIRLIDVESALSDDIEKMPEPSVFPDKSDIGLILFTSGTTGKRKAVVINHGAFATAIHIFVPGMKYTGHEVEYIGGNFDHAFPFGRLRNLLAIGATVIVDNGPAMPQKILTALRETGADRLASPAANILLLGNRYRDDFVALADQIKTLKLASQIIPVDFKRNLIDWFPNTEIYENFGMSEAMRSTFISYRDELNFIHTSGRAAKGNEIEIRDPETLDVLEPNIIGKIAIRGPHLMDGYWNMPDKTAATLIDGWFLSDDQGYMEPSGHLVMLGRIDELINSGGEKYTPEALEQPLKTHLNDYTFAVCAMNDPHGVLGQVPVLMVEDVTATDTPQKWTAWPAMRIGLIKKRMKNVPKYAYVMTQLPKTSTGKVQRKKITLLLNELD